MTAIAQTVNTKSAKSMKSANTDDVSARLGVAGLPQDAFGTACPIAGSVPAMLAEDPLFHELCSAFDELLAPMESALDCFSAYLDPELAPADFLGWLDAMVGGGAEPWWPPERRRAHPADVMQAHRLRGTAEGLRRTVAAAVGVPLEQVAVDDPGGVRYSVHAVEDADARQAKNGTAEDGTADHGTAHQGARAASAVVRVRMSAADPAGAPHDAELVSALVRDVVERARPVTCQVKIEVG
jgi:phage tail-like protein